jgi:hypothetical protein
MTESSELVMRFQQSTWEFIEKMRSIGSEDKSDVLRSVDDFCDELELYLLEFERDD